MSEERLQEGSEALVEMQTDHAIARTRALAQKRQCDEPWAVDFDGEHCIECEIELPQVRLDYGYVRCTRCQELIERESKRRG